MVLNLLLTSQMTLPQKKVHQQSFFKPSKKAHGGSLNVQKRKTLRPLDTKMPLHLVLKSDKAKGPHSLVKFHDQISKVMDKQAGKFQVTIYERNINFNHIHLLIRGKSRRDLQNFFRALAGIIARLVTGAKKGKVFGRFWSYLVFSRVLNSWKGDFTNTRNYIIQNTKEVLGLIPYQKRKTRYKNSS